MKKRFYNLISKHYGKKNLFNVKNIKQYIDKEIYFKKIHQVDVVYVYKPTLMTFVQIATRVGSQIETKDEWGISHILEHLVFKGSKKRPSGKEIVKAYSRIGADVNAYTDYDHTNYHMSMLNSVFEEGIDILVDMFLNPLLKEEDLKKEINPILSEYREKKDDPEDFLIEETFTQFLEPYHPILGTEENIQNVSIEKIKSFKEKYYKNSNMIITGYGGIKPELFFDKIKYYFSDRKEREYTDIKYPKCQYKQKEIVIKKKNIQQNYFMLVYPAFPYDSKDKYKQNLLNFILGGMDSSLLFTRIRDELGLSCYDIYSEIIRNPSFSVLQIFAGIHSNQIRLLEKEIFTIIDRICNEYIEEENLVRAKNIIKTNIIENIETSRGFSNLLLNSLLHKDHKNPLEEILNQIESITKEDLLETAQKTFNNIYCKGILISK